MNEPITVDTRPAQAHGLEGGGRLWACKGSESGQERLLPASYAAAWSYPLIMRIRIGPGLKARANLERGRWTDERRA